MPFVVLLRPCLSLRFPPAVARLERRVQGAGLAHHGDNLQDILRILTLWFNYGALPDVEQALQDGFNRVTVDTWLVVIPQACTWPAKQLPAYAT